MFSNRSNRIFVAEHDIAVQQYLLNCLEIAGYLTASSRVGTHAAQSIKLNRPAAVLLSLDLPGKNGFDVLREVRAYPDTKNTPILILTSSGKADDVCRALRLGADDCIIKPFHHRVLLMRLERQLVGVKSGRSKPRMDHPLFAPAAGRMAAFDTTQP